MDTPQNTSFSSGQTLSFNFKDKNASLPYYFKATGATQNTASNSMNKRRRAKHSIRQTKTSIVDSQTSLGSSNKPPKRSRSNDNLLDDSMDMNIEDISSVSNNNLLESKIMSKSVSDLCLKGKTDFSPNDQSRNTVFATPMHQLYVNSAGVPVPHHVQIWLEQQRNQGTPLLTPIQVHSNNPSPIGSLSPPDHTSKGHQQRASATQFPMMNEVTTIEQGIQPSHNFVIADADSTDHAHLLHRDMHGSTQSLEQYESEDEHVPYKSDNKYKSTPNLRWETPYIGDVIVMHVENDIETADEFKQKIEESLRDAKLRKLENLKVRTLEEVCLPGTEVTAVMDIIRKHYFCFFIMITQEFIKSLNSKNDETYFSRVLALLSQRDKSHLVIPVVGNDDMLRVMPTIFKNLIPLKLTDKKIADKLVKSILCGASQFKKKKKKSVTKRISGFFSKTVSSSEQF